ncbi:MAG: sulfate reduction electron transfer complex DsrMKJOP subunit DsrJ [Ignavibacteria bacterium]|nr:sulfate reduction electron transfer complex DsrMKJOP subunit DsrJ [Ignavibacteria bacterium]
MKLYDGWKIILGLIVFFAFFSLPVWINLSSAQSRVKPQLEYPKDSKQCVENKDYMNHYHMNLLNFWRDSVVRMNYRYVVRNGVVLTHNGKPLEMSLTLACLKCHNNKQKFCDQCHNYLDVKPYCWDCHIEPKGGLK